MSTEGDREGKKKKKKGTKRWGWFAGSGVDISDNDLKAGYL